MGIFSLIPKSFPFIIPLCILFILFIVPIVNSLENNKNNISWFFSPYLGFHVNQCASVSTFCYDIYIYIYPMSFIVILHSL